MVLWVLLALLQVLDAQESGTSWLQLGTRMKLGWEFIGEDVQLTFEVSSK